MKVVTVSHLLRGNYRKLYKLITFLSIMGNILQAVKQRNRLSTKDTKDAINKNKPEKLTHAEVQALIDSANAKKLLDTHKRYTNEQYSILESRLATIEADLKKIKENKK